MALISVPARVSISATHPLRGVAVAHGFTVEREYSTVNNGFAVTLQAPEGTVEEAVVSRGANARSAYATSSIRRYRTPDGWVCEAGGGGPSDLDKLREVVTE